MSSKIQTLLGLCLALAILVALMGVGVEGQAGTPIVRHRMPCRVRSDCQPDDTGLECETLPTGNRVCECPTFKASAKYPTTKTSFNTVVEECTIGISQICVLKEGLPGSGINCDVGAKCELIDEEVKSGRKELGYCVSTTTTKDSGSSYGVKASMASIMAFALIVLRFL